MGLAQDRPLRGGAPREPRAPGGSPAAWPAHLAKGARRFPGTRPSATQPPAFLSEESRMPRATCQIRARRPRDLPPWRPRKRGFRPPATRHLAVQVAFWAGAAKNAVSPRTAPSPSASRRSGKGKRRGGSAAWGGLSHPLGAAPRATQSPKSAPFSNRPAQGIGFVLHNAVTHHFCRNPCPAPGLRPIGPPAEWPGSESGGSVKRSLRNLAMADGRCVRPSPRPTGLDAATRPLLPRKASF